MNRLILCFLIFTINLSLYAQNIVDKEGAVVRSDTLQKKIYLCFTGHEYVDGFEHVLSVLNKQKIKGSFFLTGDFVRSNEDLVRDITKQGHFVGAHSDKHLLYCDWTKRDSLLYSETQIKEDILQNLRALKKLDIHPKHFMPPYEWHNKKVVKIASQLNQITVNYSSGTRSNADYTTPDMANYISSDDILESIYSYESFKNMNGFHLLIHPGTSPKRKDKLYLNLDGLITKLKKKGYQFSKF
ncbi:polysaccharide deacetylase family protein [Aureibaculum algae]|uniref:Polysaccharide deacetylase family protein n=1 Tax=Aureibaculum algae TaxID=2584122 RepID=A0A5B7TPN0_9FLAO|nr:polysaccharide deacetylase family protein [Aureibaculum algae]QCX38190.1 polysaccharide deacetylase family protein [Aureibaculum algae]